MHLRFFFVMFTALLTACASSPEQQRAEQNQRQQAEAAKYQWKVDFCRKKGITSQHPSFDACLRLAQSTLDVQAAEAARCAPNWFAISAALAKPQLGGFSASVGDASKEMARQKSTAGCQ
jgi:hypothetical protein